MIEMRDREGMRLKGHVVVKRRARVCGREKCKGKGSGERSVGVKEGKDGPEADVYRISIINSVQTNNTEFGKKPKQQ